MITEQELTNAIVTIEHGLRDAESARAKEKSDAAKLKDLSLQLAESRIKLQVLHWAQGITGMVSEQELNDAISKLESQISQFQSPQSIDLFEPKDEKDLAARILAAKSKLLTLQFVAGAEKKIL
jgi:FKBP-type peptidyl-prolyl cis-trans isomerase (trigger factor)